MGRLSAEKGQLLLVEAARRLAAKGVRFELVLVGDGPMRNEIAVLIAKMFIEHAVLVALYARARR